MTKDPNTIQGILESFIRLMSMDFGVQAPTVIFVPESSKLHDLHGCYYPATKTIIVYEHEREVMYLRTSIHEFVHHLQYDREEEKKEKGVETAEYDTEFEALRIETILSDIYEEKFKEVKNTSRAEPFGRIELCKRMKDILSFLLEYADKELFFVYSRYDIHMRLSKAIELGWHKSKANFLIENIMLFLTYVDKVCLGSWLGNHIELVNMYLETLRNLHRDKIEEAYDSFIRARNRTIKAYGLKLKIHEFEF